YRYDNRGRLLVVENELQQKTQFSYNSSGQVATITRYADADTALTTRYTYSNGELSSITDSLGRSSAYLYDQAGRLVSTTSPDGQTAVSSYDASGRVTEQTDAQGNTFRYQYDNNSNLLSFTDSKGQITRWSYDSRNRPLTRQDPAGKEEKYRYDLAGKLIYVTDRMGQITGYRYDGLNRLIEAGFGATRTESPEYQSTIRYSWDKGDRLIRTEDSLSGITTHRYDDFFDAVTEESSAAGTVRYSYYANGLRKSMTPGGGSTVNYRYDVANRLIGITQEAGSGSALPSKAQTVSIDYDLANRRIRETLPNGIEVAYTWDSADQLTAIRYLGQTGALLGDVTYGYDNSGRRIRTGGSMAETLLPESATAVHEGNNRLIRWNEKSFNYDANGNLLSDGSNTYTWNSRNQLVAISGASTASFSYDVFGRRSSKTVNGQTTLYLYDGDNPIQEARAPGQIIANLLTGQGIDERYSRTQNNLSQTYLTDVLGSTLALSDDSQKLTARYSYSPYGESRVSGEARGNRYTYTGREDDGTGLYYYRARYYHPQINRFISEDPIGLRGGNNRYAYVEGNPLQYKDPLGLNPMAACIAGPLPCAGGAIIAAGIAAGCILITPGDSQNIDPNAYAKPGTDTPPLPDDLVGDNGRKSSGKRKNTDQPAEQFPGTVQGLTGGNTHDDGKGNRKSPNRVLIRPPNPKLGKGPRIDIPAKGDKPHETIHYPPETVWPW
ncbi:MAG: RHS repeat-associated core domain-containing protein, partial [Enterobacteriaceae bacterium]